MNLAFSPKVRSEWADFSKLRLQARISSFKTGVTKCRYQEIGIQWPREKRVPSSFIFEKGLIKPLILTWIGGQAFSKFLGKVKSCKVLGGWYILTPFLFGNNQGPNLKKPGGCSMNKKQY